MIEGLLAILGAVGLVFSIFGAWTLMHSTPIFGADDDGYGATDRSEPLKTLVQRQRRGWSLLLIGFSLQLAAAVGAAVVAFCRA